jgi:hypothetical protein
MGWREQSTEIVAGAPAETGWRAKSTPIELPQTEWENLPVGQLSKAGGEKMVGGAVQATGESLLPDAPASNPVVSRMSRLMAGVTAARDIARSVVPESVAQKIADVGAGMYESGVRESQDAQASMAGTQPSWLQRGVNIGAESSVPMALSMLSGGLGAGGAATSIIGATSAANKYGEQRSEGKPPGQAAISGLVEGGIEGITEWGPNKFMFDAAAPLMSRLWKGAAADAVGEQFATGGQGIADVIAGTPDPRKPGQQQTVTDWLKNDYPQQALDTLAASTVMAPIGAGTTMLNPSAPRVVPPGKLELQDAINKLAPAYQQPAQGEEAPPFNPAPVVAPTQAAIANEPFDINPVEQINIEAAPPPAERFPEAAEPKLMSQLRDMARQVEAARAASAAKQIEDAQMNEMAAATNAAAAPPPANIDVSRQSMPVENIELAPPPSEDAGMPDVPGSKVKVVPLSVTEIDAAPAPTPPAQLALPAPKLSNTFQIGGDGVAQQLSETEASNLPPAGRGVNRVESVPANRPAVDTFDAAWEPAPAPVVPKGKKGKGKNTRLSQSVDAGQTNRRGPDAAKLQSAFDEVTSSLKGALRVRVVPTSEGFPPEVRAKIAAEQAEGVDAAFHNGEVWLAADQMHTPQVAAKKFFHEQVAHAGLRGLFRVTDSGQGMAAFDRLLDDVVAAYDAGKFDSWFGNETERRQYLDLHREIFSDDREAAEEFLARLAEEGAADPSGFLAKARVMLAQAVRRVPGLGKYMGAISKGEVDSILAAARRYTESGDQASQEFAGSRLGRRLGTSADPRLSRKVDGPSGEKLAKPPLEPSMADVVTALQGMSKDANLFANKKHTGKRLDGMLPPGFTVEPIVMTPDFKAAGWEEIYSVTSPTGGKALVDRKRTAPGQRPSVYVDISGFDPGEGGDRVYQAVGDWAHNNRYVFIGDPAGLSPIAQVRRTEQMISSALKWGTTDHLRPHPKQIRPETEGVSGFSWKEGDTANNIRQMARASYETIRNLVPEVSQIRYNFDSKRLENTDGNPVSDEELAQLAAEARTRSLKLTAGTAGASRDPDIGTVPVGTRTLKRALLTKSLFDRTAQGGWGAVLDGLSGGSATDVHPTFRKTFLSRDVERGVGARGDLNDEQTASTSRSGGFQESGRIRRSSEPLAIDGREDQGNGREGAPLSGLPTPVEVNGKPVEFGPFLPAHKAAERYMRSRGLAYKPLTTYQKVDRARAERIADEYDRMEHAPQSPEVKRAYAAMVSETVAQYREIMKTGLKVEFIDYAKTGDPYGNPRNVILDVRDNNHMWVFSTADGFGSDTSFDPNDNPLLADTGLKISGRPALANDIFRVVHDYFGHIKDGIGFRAEGEENAWRSHSTMYTPLARRAMTSETRGQNSWLNFGPYGESNRSAKSDDTHYADQKTGLMPEWTTSDGAPDNDSRLSRDVERGADRNARTYQRENTGSVIVGGRPGRFGFKPENPDAALPPTVEPQARAPNLERVGQRVGTLLNSRPVAKLMRDLFGVTEFKVAPVRGTWEGEQEPSFVLSGKGMTFEKASDVAKLMGWAFTQDEAIVTQPQAGLGGLPALYATRATALSAAEQRELLDKVIASGLNATTTTDGKGVKFIYFGDEEGADEFGRKVSELAKSAGLSAPSTFVIRSERYGEKTYDSRSDSSLGKQAWISDAAAKPSGVFRRTVDTLVVPYARAVAGEGYRLSPDRFGQRFALSPAQVEYLRDALRPLNGKTRSAAALLSGEEDLEVEGTGKPTKTGALKKSVNDILWALQNRAAAHGQIEPGDFSERAKRAVADTIADEIITYLRTPRAKDPIGWYDKALKEAKERYHKIFPEIATDRDAELLFDAILGITSQGNDVTANSLFAARTYWLVKREGKSLSEAVDILNGSYGNQTRAIEGNLKKLDHLIKANGYDYMRAKFNERKTVKEWREEFRTNPKLRATGGGQLNIQGASDQSVTGWFVFGPKIGSFINNLHGDYSTLTADLWFSRTWNRMLGYSFKFQSGAEAKQIARLRDEIKAGVERADPDLANYTDEQVQQLLDDTEALQEFADNVEGEYRKGGYKEKTDLRRAAKNWVESKANSLAVPRSDNERLFQQQTMEAAQAQILEETGRRIEIADMQAALWYAEKELVAKLGVENKRSAPEDYAGAARKTAATLDGGKLFYVAEQKKKSGDIPSRYIHGTEGSYLEENAADARAYEAPPTRLSRNVTKSPEFKRWFGDSKVVDESGEPRVMYHGTSKDVDFTAFRTGTRGAWFAADRDEASNYAADNDSQGFKQDGWKLTKTNTKSRVMPVYLRIENPYIVTERDLRESRNQNYVTQQREQVRQAKMRGHDGMSYPGGIWIAFEPAQIKSALGNNGNFDSKKKDIRLARNVSTAENVLKSYRERLGEPMYNKLAAGAKRIFGSVHLADTLPVEFKRQMRAMRAEISNEVEKIKPIVASAGQLTAQERNLISDIVERTMAPGLLPPSHLLKIVTTMRAAMHMQREEQIRLKMLAEESRDRWGDEYLARYYTKHILDRPWDKLIRKASLKIEGTHLKGRGIVQPVPRADVAEWEALGWEARFDRGGDKVGMWRDWSIQQRQQWGEVRDGLYRFTRGYLESAKDVAMGRLFEQMAKASYTRDTDPQEGDYVEVPKKTIGQSAGRNINGKFVPEYAYRYGMLAGKWIPRDVWHQLAPLWEQNDTTTEALINAYLKGLSFWKEGKTAMNPVVHSNNIVSNTIGVYWAIGSDGLSPALYQDTMREYIDKGKYYKEGKEAGLFGSGYIGAEIRNMIPDIGMQPTLAGVATGWVEKMVDVVYRKSKLETARKAMGDMYQAEDEFFKMMLYKHARTKQGMDVQEAIDFSEQYIFNYADVPKGVRIMKATGWPFFSYTYKAIPMVARTFSVYPERILAMYLAFQGINVLSYMLLGAGGDGEDDEATERAVMKPYMKGRSIVGSQKNIRMPWNANPTPDDGPDVPKTAVFMDVSRRIPLGTFFDATNQTGGIGIFDSFMPNSPVLSVAAGILYNVDTFTGDPLVPEYDQGDDWDSITSRYGAYGQFLMRQVVPNNPAIPGSYSFNKVMNGFAGSLGKEIGPYTGTDYRGVTQSAPRALADAFLGVKLRNVDVEHEKAGRMRETRFLMDKIKGDMRRTNNDMSMLDSAKEKEFVNLTKKLMKMAERLERLQNGEDPE